MIPDMSARTALMMLFAGLTAPAVLAPAQEVPTPKGTAELLRGRLDEFARAVLGPDGRDPRRATAIEAELPAYDWKDVDVPSTVLAFAKDRERRSRGREKLPWGFDAMPRAAVRIAPAKAWADLIVNGVDGVIRSLGFADWKKLPGGKSRSDDLFINSAAFLKVASLALDVFTGYEGRLLEDDARRIRDALFRVYATYGLDTVHLSWEYSVIPAGFFLQFGAWMGDLRALTLATNMADAWLSDPKESHLRQFEQAVLAIDRFNTRFSSGTLETKVALIRRLRRSTLVPEAIKVQLRTPAG